MSRIPVRNLWLLQLLASDLYTRTELIGSGSEFVGEDMIGLLSRLLADATENRIRFGLSTGFYRAEENLRRVRGKIDVLETTRGQLLSQGLVRCQFDALTVDTTVNRLIHSALRRVAAFPEADPRCSSLASWLGSVGVSEVAPNRHVAASLHRNRAALSDREIIFIAELIHELEMPTPGTGEQRFVSPQDDLDYLRKLFEKAAFGVYRKNLVDWKVSHGTRLSWRNAAGAGIQHRYLPSMNTDILLRHADNPAMIIDTKFTGILRPTQFSIRFRSEYIYQIYTYVMSQQEILGSDCRGMLLHPVTDGSVRETVEIQGHEFRFATVDLWGSYQDIIDDFLSAVE